MYIYYINSCNLKTKKIIVVLLFLSSFVFSQEKDQNKGWYFGPNISYSAIDGYYNKFNFNVYGSALDYKRISYSVGADGMYAFGRKHILTFGIHYQETHYSFIEYLPSDTLSNSHQISNIYGKATDKYLLLPVHMDFCLFKGNISPYIMTGFIPGIFLEGKSYGRTTYINGKVEEANGCSYNPGRTADYGVGFSWQIGFGVDVNVNKTKFRAFVYDSGDGPIVIDAIKGTGRYYSIHTGISYYLKTSHH